MSLDMEALKSVMEQFGISERGRRNHVHCHETATKEIPEPGVAHSTEEAKRFLVSEECECSKLYIPPSDLTTETEIAIELAYLLGQMKDLINGVGETGDGFDGLQRDRGPMIENHIAMIELILRAVSTHHQFFIRDLEVRKSRLRGMLNNGQFDIPAISAKTTEFTKKYLSDVILEKLRTWKQSEESFWSLSQMQTRASTS